MSDSSSQPVPFLNTVEGEIALFRSLMKARPVGRHRDFAIVCIQNEVFKYTGRSVPAQDVWAKLNALWNLELLEATETHEYDIDDDSSNAFDTVHELKEGDNLNTHPFFKSEYAPPEELRPLMMERCRRDSNETPSPPPPSSPPTPVISSVSKGKKVSNSRTSSTMKRAAAAGLVGGDSDSSALTQESGDEGVAAAPTPPSVATDTEEGNVPDGAGVGDVEEDDIDMPDASPAPSTASRGTRTRKSVKNESLSNQVKKRVKGAAAAAAAKKKKGKK